MAADFVVLLRHGRTASNHEGRWQGQLDVPLDEVGAGQAVAASKALAALLEGLDGKVRLVSSDLSRASATAGALAETLGVDLELDPRLRETDAGNWQGLTAAEITAQWPEEYEAWRAGRDVPLGGAETRSQAGARAAACIAELEEAQDGGTLVCVSHGAALRGAVCELAGLGWEATAAFEPIGNCHWVVMRRTVRGWRIVTYNQGV
ncbi:histidine phosphatase family protein [Spongisporangium articulatum]|uniref:Histidine phosphatase family protein n=1 Tax=Spongisporangium articulatum TaxID=3362603 RepID=A0ABW8AL04_9ACTN